MRRLHLLAVCCLVSAASAQYLRKVITTPAGIFTLQYDSMDNRVFGSADSSRFVVIDGAADSVIAALRVSGQPMTACYDAHDNRLYWVDWTNNVIQGMNAATFQPLTPIPVGLTPGVIGWNPANDRLYCSCTDGSVHLVRVIDCVAESVVATIAVSEDLSEYCFDTHDNKVYCTIPPSVLVQVIDGATDSVVASIPTNDAKAICYNQQMNRVCWGRGNGDSVTVVDCAADTVVGKVRMGQWSLSCCYNPRRSKLYFGAYADDNVTVINCATNQPLATIQFSQPLAIPWALCYDPHTDVVYAVNHESLTVVDGSTNTVVKSMATPCLGRSLAFNPIQNRVYFGGDDHYEVAVVQDSGTGAIGESTTPYAVRYAPCAGPIIVRGVLSLPAISSPKSQASSCLLDISGRRVLDLKPGPNDVSRLAPGVYFVHEAVGCLPSAVSEKVILTR